MEGKVSIIIPVYNVEKYVDICLKSILHQTYRNIEVIVVDDGSRDRSGAICDRFAKKDSRITVIHQENGGVSRARNNGIDHATGDYICFVDSDDWLPRDSVEVLVKRMEETGADFVYGNVCYITAKTIINPNFEERQIELQDKTEFAKFYIDLNWGPCGKLYRVNIITNHECYFPEDIKSGEDTIYLTRYIKHCNVMASVYHDVYFYNKMVDGSATGSYFADYNNWKFMLFEGWKNILQQSKMTDDNKYVVSAISITAIRCLAEIVSNYLCYSNEKHDGKVIEAYEYLSKYIIWDQKDFPFYNHPSNDTYRRRIAETIREHGVGDELYSLMPHVGKNQSPLKKLLKSMIAPIKLAYYRTVM